MGRLGLEADGLALLFGALTAYLDYYDEFTEKIGRLPIAFRANPVVIAISIGCGALAAIACAVSGADPQGALSTLLGLKTPDPWRGLVVGGMVLILLRSQLLNIQGSPLGGDYLYRFFQRIAIQDVNDRWTGMKSRFKTRNIAACLAIATFETDIMQNIAGWIQTRPDKLRTTVQNKLNILPTNRPAGAFDPTAPAWIIYYNGLLDVALDAAGPRAVVLAFPGQLTA